MKKELLITELKKISKGLFNKKQFQDAGRINLAIDVLEILPSCEHTSTTNALGGDKVQCLDCGEEIK